MSIKKVTFDRINLISIKIQTYEETIIDSFDTSYLLVMYLGRSGRQGKGQRNSYGLYAWKSTPELIETSIAKRKGTDGHAPLYIFNRGNDQGFVIISGDDCMPYVLGYTEKGDFDPQTLLPAMLDWLEGYSRMIEAAQAQGLGPRVQTRANDKENIAPLVSAHWSQGAPLQ